MPPPTGGRLDGWRWSDTSGNVPELALREQKDGNIGVYSAMVGRGELVMIPGTRTTPPALVLSDAIERFGTPEVVLADRYRKTGTGRRAGVSSAYLWSGGDLDSGTVQTT